MVRVFAGAPGYNQVIIEAENGSFYYNENGTGHPLQPVPGFAFIKPTIFLLYNNHSLDSLEIK
jgi:hypothetical protein